MTIENLKQIAIKYATTKGSRVPLAPDELCNAVVQYFNEFLKITADINTIQVAVTEEGGNIVFTITGNTLDGKAFTPIVITVDHNDFVTDQEFEEFKTSVTEQLNNKLNKITSPMSNFVLYANIEGNDTQIRYASDPATNSILYRDETGKTAVVKGVSGQDVANMENIADLEEKIPSTDNFLLKNVINIINYNKFKIIDEIGNNIIGKADTSNNMSIGSSNYAIQLNSSIRPIIYTPDATYNVAYASDIPEYTNVDSVSYDSTNGAIVAYDGANEIHIPLLAGENVTINASEDNKKIVISAAGGGGAADINTIQVAVTEEGGNIVFTITGNTLDGKAFTPIVITVDHNDFVTDQEFEEFKTSVTEQLNNKLNKITSPMSNFVLYANIEGNDTQIRYASDPATNSILYRDETGKTAVVKGVSGQDVANMENIADLEEKIPSTDNFLLKNVINIINYNKFKIIDEIGNNIIGKADTSNNMSIGSSNYAIQLNSSIRPIIYTPDATYNVAYASDIPEYTNVDSVSYDSTNGAIVAYDGANEIHIPLLAGENVTINASEDNKKIVISAAGGGGAGDVTAAGNNIFTGENEFRNYIYDTSYFCFVDTKEDYLTNGCTTTIKNGGFDISYYENGEGKYWTTYADNQIINKDIDMEGEVVIKFPKKEGTFALTSDIINEPIYFISFYANDTSEPCHLIGTIMSKNSYGTGQKTNEEFAVMLADNLYTNSNEGLAAYGRLANKDILCIYSEDGLSIRCLDEENSEVDLPTVMFFVMETEL